jgi:hypothetical protein
MGILDAPGMTPASLKTNSAHRNAVAEAAFFLADKSAGNDNPRN